MQQQAERPKELIVPIELMDGIVQYLMEKPYKEVIHLLSGLEKTARGNVMPSEDRDGLLTPSIPG